MKYLFIILVSATTFIAGHSVFASGPFTLPFSSSYSITAYFDLDARVDWTSDYLHVTPWYDPGGDSWTTGYAYDGHQGTDYATPSGTEILVAEAGTVTGVLDDQVNTYDAETDTCSSPETGNKVVVEHENNLETRYYHLLSDSLEVDVDDPLLRGINIAKSGNTGCSTGNHLHFEIRDNGTSVDPYNDDLWTTNPPSFYHLHAAQVGKATGSTISNSGYLTLWQTLGNGYSIDGNLSIEFSLSGNVTNSGITLRSCLVSDLSDCLNNYGGADRKTYYSSNVINASGTQNEYIMTFDNIDIDPDRYIFFRLPAIGGMEWVTGYGNTSASSFGAGQCIKYYSASSTEYTCPNSVSDLYFKMFST